MPPSFAQCSSCCVERVDLVAYLPEMRQVQRQKADFEAGGTKRRLNVRQLPALPALTDIRGTKALNIHEQRRQAAALAANTGWER